MTRKLALVLLVLGLVLSLLSPVLAQGQGDIAITASSAQMDFPLSLNFSVQARSSNSITEVRVRYKVQQLSIADVTSEAYAAFTPGTSVKATYSLDMRKVGGLPPGARLTYWWLVRDAAGHSLETMPQSYQLADNRYSWTSLSEGKINLFWYRGGNDFGRTLMTTAQQALVKLAQDTGASPEKPIDIYIYATTGDLQGAMIFPQEWTGGVTYTRFNIIAIGIAPDNLDWGKTAMVHELTHAIIAQIVFNPYSGLPVWLDEGLAMYTEGVLSPQYSTLLADAVKQDRLMSVRSIASPFSAETNKSLLSYAESFSLVDYLIRQYGPQKMRQLLDAFRQGTTYDGALEQVYGFNMDRLNEEWKSWVRTLYVK